MTFIGPRITPPKDKRRQRAEIELLTIDYLANGGQITELEPQKSECQLVWRDYAESAFADRQDTRRDLGEAA